MGAAALLRCLLGLVARFVENGLGCVPCEVRSPDEIAARAREAEERGRVFRCSHANSLDDQPPYVESVAPLPRALHPAITWVGRVAEAG